MCVRSHTSREIKNATISEFSTFLNSSKSRKQFLLRLTFFYPIYGQRLKFFNFYGYRLNFWPFYAYRLTPLRPSVETNTKYPSTRGNILYSEYKYVIDQAWGQDSWILANFFFFRVGPKPQPRPQGFSLKKWVGREKAPASASHVSPRTP